MGGIGLREAGGRQEGAAPPDPSAVTHAEPRMSGPPRAFRALTGQIGGRYTILREVGRGGMGAVYAAYDSELDRKVAIKMIHQEARAGRSKAELPNLLGEAQALARLSHPNVVQVYDVGTHGDQVFLAMEYVDGETLREWQRDPRRTWRELLAAYRQAGEGLAAAHAAGLIHCDIKPDNLLRGDDGRIRVTDFGLARQHAAAPRPSAVSLPTAGSAVLVNTAEFSAAGKVVGTPAYMPPEQLVGAPITASADIFALCVALWEGLMGQRPFAGATVAEIHENIVLGRMIPPPADHPAPRWLRELLLRGLAIDPDVRWPSVRALVEAIDLGLARSRRRRRTLGLAAITAIVAAISLGAWSWGHHQEQAQIATCEALGAEISALWDPTTEQALGQTIAASDHPNAGATAALVLPRIDRWTRSWSEVRASLCREHTLENTLSTELYHQAEVCLEEHLLALEALLSEFSGDDPTLVNHAVIAAANLGQVERCRERRHLERRPPAPQADLAVLRGLHGDLARVKILEEATHYAAGAELAAEVLAAAESLGWPPLIAEARLRHANVLLNLGDQEAAITGLEDAYFEAARAQALEIAAEAAIRLIYAHGHQRNDRAAGLRWSRHAELALEALDPGSRAAYAVDLFNDRGLVYQVAGEHHESARDFAAAIDHSVATYGPEHPNLATIIANLAIAQGQLGQLAEARETAARALAHDRRDLGEDHPRVSHRLRVLAARTSAWANTIDDPTAAKRAYREAIDLFEAALPQMERLDGGLAQHLALHRDLGLTHFFAGDLTAADAAFSRAWELQRQHRGADDPGGAYILVGWSQAQIAAGELQRAKETLERALTLQGFGEHEPTDANDWVTAVALNLLGLVELQLDDLAAAHLRIDAATARFRKLPRTSARLLAGSLRARARLAVADGDLAEAAALLAEAAANSNTTELAEPRLRLAQALAQAHPPELARARELAILARDGFLRGGDATATRRAEADAWLRTLGPE